MLWLLLLLLLQYDFSYEVDIWYEIKDAYDIVQWYFYLFI